MSSKIQKMWQPSTSVSDSSIRRGPEKSAQGSARRKASCVKGTIRMRYSLELICATTFTLGKISIISCISASKTRRCQENICPPIVSDKIPTSKTNSKSFKTHIPLKKSLTVLNHLAFQLLITNVLSYNCSQKVKTS